MLSDEGFDLLSETMPSVSGVFSIYIYPSCPAKLLTYLFLLATSCSSKKTRSLISSLIMKVSQTVTPSAALVHFLSFMLVVPLVTAAPIDDYLYTRSPSKKYPDCAFSSVGSADLPFPFLVYVTKLEPGLLDDTYQNDNTPLRLDQYNPFSTVAFKRPVVAKANESPDAFYLKNGTLLTLDGKPALMFPDKPSSRITYPGLNPILFDPEISSTYPAADPTPLNFTSVRDCHGSHLRVETDAKGEFCSLHFLILDFFPCHHSANASFF